MWETLKPFPLFFGGAQNQPQTRYIYNFNGVDNYIETGQRIVDVDNLEGLILEGVFDSGVSGTIFSQSVSVNASDREFQIYTFGAGTDSMYLVAGGENVELLSPANIPSERGTYRFEFASGNIIRTLFNGSLLSSVAYTVGLKREPTATFKIMARGAGEGVVGFLRSGICYNVKINDGSVYNYPINDRTFGVGAVIKNTGSGADATGVNLLESGWQEINI